MWQAIDKPLGGFPRAGRWPAGLACGRREPQCRPAFFVSGGLYAGNVAAACPLLSLSKKWLCHVFRGLHCALATLARAALRAEKALRRKAFRSRRTEGELPQSGKRSPPGGCRRSRLKPTGAPAPEAPKGLSTAWAAACPPLPCGFAWP